MVVDDFQTNTSHLPRATHASDSNNIGQNDGWHDSSRIIRVSRCSGGKDRHSKVWTSRGLRDRRIRLSVTTAIQFYDIQDRLGYDQPSKAVEWLIQAAADPISELPSLNTSFPEKSPIHTQSDCGIFPLQTHHHHSSLSKSETGFNSETVINGSGLSLSRDEFSLNRKTAKEINQNHDPISENGSFTELLTAGDSMEALSGQRHGQWSHEYLNTTVRHQHPSMTVPSTFNLVGQNHQACPNSNHLIPPGEDDYDSTMCPCLAGCFNRGTLQSNFPSNLHRFNGDSNPPLLIGAPMQTMTDHFPSGLENRLHICYGDATRISESKGKGKS